MLNVANTTNQETEEIVIKIPERSRIEVPAG